MTKINVRGFMSTVVGWFTSGKAEAALREAASLVPEALVIVELLDTLCPGKTLDEVNGAFQHYGIPFSKETASGVPPGLSLLHLGSELLKQEYPGVGTTIANAAVQMAVTGSHAQ